MSNDYDIFVIKSDDIIENALRKIEANKYRTLIVIDEAHRVLGTLTDGDIRKALIAKRSLLAPINDVMNTRYYSVTVDNTQQGQAIFVEHFYINIIPVINDKGILQDILYRNKFNVTDKVE